MSNAWPVRSIVSRREEGKRPEELWQRRASVEDDLLGSLRKKFKTNSSRGAPEREEPRGCRNLAAGCLVASESSKGAVGICELRRGIPSDWWHLEREDEREVEEGSAAFL
jgi:hypothetical protein